MPLWTPTGGWCFTPWGIGQGFAAFSLTYGSATLQRWLGGVLVTLLGPSAEAGQRVQNAMAVATNANATYLASELGELAEFVDAIIVPNQIIGEALMTMAYAVNNAIWSIGTQRLPLVQLQAAQEVQAMGQYLTDAVNAEFAQAYHDLEGYANYVGSQADAYTNAVEHGIVTWVQSNFDTMWADLNHRFAQVTATSSSRAQTAADYAQTLADDVLTYTERETIRLRTDLAATQAWADQQITQTRQEAATGAATAANTAIADQNRVVSITLAPIWAGTAESLNTVGQKVAQLAPSLAPSITAISPVTPPDLQVALQGITAGLRNVSTAVDQCALPNCTEKNKLASQAKHLSTLIEAGAFIAFLVAAVADPEALAQDTAGVLADVVDGTVNTIKSAVGL